MAFAAAIGFYDGVHEGHRFVLSSLRQVAAEEGMQTLAVTFRQHPATLTGRREAPPLLTTLEERLQLLRCETDCVLMLDFAQISHLTAAEFMQLLRSKYGVELLLMGYDHRFGSDLLRLPADYAAAAGKASMRLRWLPEHRQAETHVSSTEIRRLLLKGDAETAARLLSRPYMLAGTVVHGREIGRRMGFPTANLQIEDADKLIPADGVYICRVEQGEDRWKGLLNIGSNPTVGGTERTLEVHIDGFSGMLYGKRLRIALLRYLRQEQRFPTTDALRRQIAADLKALRG